MSFLPLEVLLTYAKDHPKYLEVNFFGSFFTFQVDPSSQKQVEDQSVRIEDASQMINRIESSFAIPTTQNDDSDAKFLIRLRSELYGGEA